MTPLENAHMHKETFSVGKSEKKKAKAKTQAFDWKKSMCKAAFMEKIPSFKLLNSTKQKVNSPFSVLLSHFMATNISLGDTWPCLLCKLKSTVSISIRCNQTCLID